MNIAAIQTIHFVPEPNISGISRVKVTRFIRNMINFKVQMEAELKDAPQGNDLLKFWQRFFFIWN